MTVLNNLDVKGSLYLSGILVTATATELNLLHGKTAVGDASGPGASTDNAIARYDGVTGKLLQNSAATVDDTTGIITNVGGFICTAAETNAGFTLKSGASKQSGMSLWSGLANESARNWGWTANKNAYGDFALMVSAAKDGDPLAAGTVVLTVTSDGILHPAMVTAKGDLLVGSASAALARLAVGAVNGYVLTVDSAQATGMKWAAAAGGLDINGLTEETGLPDGDADFLPIYDASATANRKMTLDNLAKRSVTVTIPATSMVSPTTSGAMLVMYESATYAADHASWEFVDAAQRYIDFDVVLPNDYDGGTITAKFYWTANSTSTNPVEWRIKGVAMTDDGTMVVNWGTAQVVSDANKAAAYDLSISDATPAVTIAGTPTGGKLAHFRVDRNYGSANDTLAATAYLLAVQLTIGINKWSE